MPLDLAGLLGNIGPVGERARLLTPIPVGRNDQLLGSRVTEFEFEILERRFTAEGRPIPEAVIGLLDGVTGGEVSWTYNSAVKGSGSITVHDTKQTIDWERCRIRPVIIINSEIRTPVGVFVPAAPKTSHTATGSLWDVELLDKASLLEDVYSDPATGNAVPYSISANANVMDAIRGLIEGVGEPAGSIPVTDDVTPRPMTWDVDVTRLKIINDLLNSINYFSLWVDGMGQYQTTPYTPPHQRPPRFEALAPFEDGKLMGPDWDEDHDIYSIPNRFVATTDGDDETEGLISTAVLDPDSPYSFAARGRWITATETGVEAADQAALDKYAEWRLALAVSTSKRIHIKHVFVPDLRVNENVNFSTTDTTPALCTVYKTSIAFDELELCTTELAEVTEASLDEAAPTEDEDDE